MAAKSSADVFNSKVVTMTAAQLLALDRLSQLMEGGIPLADILTNLGLWQVDLVPAAAVNNNVVYSREYVFKVPTRVVTTEHIFTATAGTSVAFDVEVKPVGGSFGSILETPPAGLVSPDDDDAWQEALPKDDDYIFAVGDTLRAKYTGVGSGAVTTAGSRLTLKRA